MPKININALDEYADCDYPSPFNEIADGRSRKRLGDAGNLDQFGVNLCTLKPGAGSSQRHWHHNEDEFVYVISGEVVLIEDEGETILRAGDVAAFKAGIQNGHHILNRGSTEAQLLEIGSRLKSERTEYSDIDMIVIDDEEGSRYLHKDGTPY